MPDSSGGGEARPDTTGSVGCRVLSRGGLARSQCVGDAAFALRGRCAVGSCPVLSSRSGPHFVVQRILRRVVLRTSRGGGPGSSLVSSYACRESAAVVRIIVLGHRRGRGLERFWQRCGILCVENESVPSL